MRLVERTDQSTTDDCADAISFANNESFVPYGGTSIQWTATDAQVIIIFVL
jgi:hypothetical protein